MKNDICGNCRFYDPNKSVNNCKANIIGTVHPEQMGCYLIQFNNIKVA